MDQWYDLLTGAACWHVKELEPVRLTDMLCTTELLYF